jgi:hypothetical protein
MTTSDSLIAGGSGPHVRKWLVRGLAIVLALLMLGFGVEAIDAGIANYRAAGNAQTATDRVTKQAIAEADQGHERAGAHIDERYNVTLAIIAKLTSDRYAYGEEGLMVPLIHYALMPVVNAVMLSLHNILAGVCMLFGAIQFWPALRQRFPLWHRRFGMVYIIGVQIAMISAMAYLVRTPVEKIYDQVTFYVQLWILAIGVTASLWLAIYHLWRREIAQHQGYMCLNYGLLLTAPILRFGWVLMGVLAPEQRQIEGNYAVVGVLIPLSLLCGYGLFVVNRWLQRDRRQPVAQHADRQSSSTGVSQWVAVPGLLVLATAAVSTIEHFVLHPGLAMLDGAAHAIPATVIQLNQQMLAAHPLQTYVFALASLAGLLGGALWLWRASLLPRNESVPGRFTGWLLAGAAIVAGVINIAWGVQLGMPSFGSLTGGALPLFGGALLLGFGSLLGWALARQETAWATEWAVFAVFGLVAIPGFFWWFPVVTAWGMSEPFLKAGNAYRITEVVQWSMLFVPFLYAIHGDATRHKMAR